MLVQCHHTISHTYSWESRLSTFLSLLRAFNTSWTWRLSLLVQLSLSVSHLSAPLSFLLAPHHRALQFQAKRRQKNCAVILFKNCKSFFFFFCSGMNPYTNWGELPASPRPVSCLDQGAAAVPSKRSQDPIKMQARCPHEPFTVTDVLSKLPHLIPSVSHYLFTLSCCPVFQNSSNRTAPATVDHHFLLHHSSSRGCHLFGHPFCCSPPKSRWNCIWNR